MTELWGVWAGEYEDSNLHYVLTSEDEANQVVREILIHLAHKPSDDWKWGFPTVARLSPVTLDEALADFREQTEPDYDDDGGNDYCGECCCSMCLS